jgi:hypothetical protein
MMLCHSSNTDCTFCGRRSTVARTHGFVSFGSVQIVFDENAVVGLLVC